MSYIQRIDITAFDKKRWVVSTPQGNHLLINENTKNLLKILEKDHSNNEVLREFNTTYYQKLDLIEFEVLIKNKFAGADVLILEQHIKFEKKNYMSLKVNLLNKRIAAIMATPFSFLYQSIIFWILFPFSIIFITGTGWINLSINKNLFQADSLLLYTAIIYTTMLIHELGHIAACRKFGIDHGEIGFGFYSIFPVVYANVTEIWTLDKHKRTIANLSGIYLELVYASICTLIFLFTKNMVFLAAAVSINIKTLTELNPFIRFDGYWVLSDLTNTPNLLPKANAAVKNFISKIKKRNKLIIGEWNLKNILLIFYGITNWVILVIYISWIISEKWQNILGFPLTIFISIKSIIYQDSETLFRNINFDNLIVLGFYLLVFKFLIEYLFKIYKTKRSLTNPDFNGLGQER